MTHFRHTLVIAAMMAIAMTSVFAQNRSSLTPEEQLESKRYYIDAARRYSAQPEVSENALKAGMDYYRAGRSDLALSFLHKADSLGQLKSAEDRFAYFQCLKSAKKYREADAFLSAAASGSPDTLLVINANRLAYYEKISSYSGGRVNDMAMNSEFSEFGPTVFNGVLYFNSTRPAGSNKQIHRLNMQPYYNLYGVSADNPAEAVFQPAGVFGVAEQQVMVNGQSVGVLPAGINQKYHDGPVFVTPSGKHMFFTSNWDGKKRHHNNTRIRLKIYHSVRENGQWSLPQNLPFNGRDWSSQHAVFDEQTSVLYFSSNMPGGRGGFDIWMAHLEDGKWSKAQNLGKHVNTPANEVFPMLSRDGGLMFSSNGWPGMGGLDIFLSDDPTRPSINLLSGVNSEADDFQMHFTGTADGYLVTNRAGGKGDDDIWSFKANLNDIRMENGVPVQLGVNLSYKGGKKPSLVNVEVRGLDQVHLMDGPAADATAKIEAAEGSQITATANGYAPASVTVERGTIGNGDLVLTLEPSIEKVAEPGTTASGSSSVLPNPSALSAAPSAIPNTTSGSSVPASSGSGYTSVPGAATVNASYSEDFEDRSFSGLQGRLNGGVAVISKANDKDQNVTLGNAQQLTTTEAGFGTGTYGTAAFALGNGSLQVLEAMRDASGKPAYRMEVSTDGSNREGWSVSSNGQLISSGNEVPAKTGEWYDMKLVVRPDSVLAAINGKVVGGGKNPQPGASAGPMSVSSVGGSQFDDFSYQPLGKVPRVGPGELALLTAYPGDAQIVEFVRSGAGILGNTTDMEGGQVLAGGLEQIRREQQSFREALVKTAGTSVSPVTGNSKYDEIMPFDFQGKTVFSTNLPVSGAVPGAKDGGTNTDTNTGSSAGAEGSAKTPLAPGAGTANGNLTSLNSSTGATYRLVGFSDNGKPVWSSGFFGAALNTSNATNAATVKLPAGTDVGGYAGPASVSSGGNWMILSDGNGSLSWSRLNGNVWSMPMAFTHNHAVSVAGPNAKANNRDGYFDEKASTMYFSSNRVGGFGGFDIWKSVWDGKNWSVPENAGPMVNTPGDEITPFLTGMGNLIYSSNGWSGLGGQDAYVWRPGMLGPANMLKGVNSSADDIAARCYEDGSGYVSSNRAGGKGGYDVYRFNLDVDKVIAAQMTIGRSESGSSGLDDHIIAYGTVLGALEGLGESGDWLDLEIAEPEGSAAGQAYRFVNGRLVTAKNVNRRDNTLRKVMVRGRDRKGKVITRLVEVWPAVEDRNEALLLTLYYASGKTGYRKSSNADASRLIRMLRSDPSLMVKIDVYTDCRGSQEVNQRIAERRVQWLVDHLNRRVPGSAGRINASAHGEDDPSATCGCDLKSEREVCTRAQINRFRRAEVRKGNQ